MENKYYTPEIEEFYVGFEYEMKERFTDGTVKTQEEFDNAKWIKSVVDIGDIPNIHRALTGINSQKGISGIRVKYLDREDVKSLGFTDDGYEFTIYCKNYPDRYGETNNKRGVNIKAVFSENGNFLISYYPETLFEGTIKNKSELKRLLKQLNIQ